MVTEKWDQPAYTVLRNRKKEPPVSYLVKKKKPNKNKNKKPHTQKKKPNKNSSNFKTMEYKYTYSNGTIHHHCTDCEHEEGDSKQNTGIFCIKRKTVQISHILELQLTATQALSFTRICSVYSSVPTTNSRIE